MTVTAKFGGSSLADAEQFKKGLSILQSDPARRYVVDSAPGKRWTDEEKITDLLYRTHRLFQEGGDWQAPFSRIEERFLSIERQLCLPLQMEAALRHIQNRLCQGASAAYMASRGEYLTARLLAAATGFPFVDAGELIRFHEDGSLNDSATQKASSALKAYPCAVIPGFYGTYPDGEICTFSRGGSDITGSLVARAVQAEVYENWTDVDGILMADPRLVATPPILPAVSYGELRELSYMGASVLHEDAIFPVQRARIPIHVRNTNHPDRSGTWIVNDGALSSSLRTGAVTGIAGKRGFTAITLTKDGLRRHRDFAARLLNILLRYDIAVESMPSGIDNISVILHDSDIRGKMDALYHDIKEELQPDTLEIASCIALIATVGKGMARNPGIAARLLKAVAQAGVNVRILDQGPSEMNIIVGVEQRDFETAYRAIYSAFC